MLSGGDCNVFDVFSCGDRNMFNMLSNTFLSLPDKISNILLSTPKTISNMLLSSGKIRVQLALKERDILVLRLNSQEISKLKYLSIFLIFKYTNKEIKLYILEDFATLAKTSHTAQLDLLILAFHPYFLKCWSQPSACASGTKWSLN